MSASILDSSYFKDMFGTSTMREVFSDDRRFQSWLETEVALARAEAKVGLIPADVPEKIAHAAKLENLDIPAMKAAYEKIGFPILPMVKQLAAACPPDAARWVHWGATTQDIIDTGLVIQMREGLDLLSDDLDAIILSLSALARNHKNTVMAGRTFQQHAAPITFGFKVAVWLDELLRHRDRLADVKRRALVCSYGGAVGILSTLDKDGIKVLEALSAELKLEVPAISWHTARDAWAELVFWLSMTCSTFSKIASEISTLMRTEIDEVREPFTQGRGGSSTMPQKRNPVSSPIIIAIGNRMREFVPSQLTAMIQDHERAVATQPLEWLIIPEAFVLASGSFNHSKFLLDGLTVNTENMRRNLDMGGGLLMAEAVMMGLAPMIGRGAAHELVNEVSAKAIENGTTLREALLLNEEIRKYLSEPEIDKLIDPANYTGVAAEMIDRVLEKV
ncbi:MAG: adenylosuccinate lyase family protein [Balneolales bacterium]|nr:adenylosuccinate lyase family protein [Balneolales bacterium]